MTGNADMEVSSKPNVQILGVGLPNAIALAGLSLALFTLWTGNARELERFENKIETIEKDRAAAKVEYDKRITPLIDANLPYRVTFFEAALAKGLDAVNDRQDRFADALGDMRKGMADLSTDVKLVLQRLDTVFPPKKAELDGIPPQLR